MNDQEEEDQESNHLLFFFCEQCVCTLLFLFPCLIFIHHRIYDTDIYVATVPEMWSGHWVLDFELVSKLSYGHIIILYHIISLVDKIN
jgi:hypothetical protein